MKIIEILEVPTITVVPQSPEFVRGVINLRGAVLPVIDTRIKFGFSKTEFTVDTCILVVSISGENDSFLIGALVDFVSEVFEFEKSKIIEAPSIITKYKSDYIDGMIRENDRFMMVLDFDKVFSMNDLESIIASNIE